MKLIKLSIAAAVGGLLANALLKSRPEGAAGQDDSAPSGASDSNATQGFSSGQAGTGSDSPNAGERLAMGQAAGALADPDSELGLGSPNADEQEPVRSPGLSNYSLGA
jgi:hypothetical protein